MTFMLDATDLKIIETLQDKGRISWTELAKILNLSSVSSADRVKRLEGLGVIKGYKAIIDQKVLGNKLIAFITVTLVKSLEESRFADVVKKSHIIEECYHIAGEGSYLLKVHCKDIEDLEILVNKTLKTIPEVIKTVTIISLAGIKEKNYEE